MTTPPGTILKPEAPAVPPNVVDYDAERSTFTWAAARAELDRLPGGGVNIAHEAVGRRTHEPLATKTAIRFVAKDGTHLDVSYRELDEQARRFAAVLAELGVRPGERVFVASPRIRQLYAAALGTWLGGAVFCPLFSAFGPEPIRQRMTIGEGAVLVTTEDLYRKRIEPIRDQLPTLRHVLVARASGALPPGTEDLDALMHAARHDVPTVETRAEDPAIIHFTSGTTGTPKGALHVHEAVVAHRATARAALDLHPDDVFWCTADPGWVTGTSYGIIAPLTIGATMVVDEAEFDAERWYHLLAEHRVTVWYTAPTAIRMMMRLGADVVRDHDVSSLRFIASVGEPLPPHAVTWGVDAFGLPIHDNWWQTETGAIMVANYASMPIRPGSMGRPLPGIDVAILAADDEGDPVLDGAGRAQRLDEPDAQGLLCLRPGWPSMMRTYLGAEERYRKAFVTDADGDEWYVSGDLARRDADGYVWFLGRGDDVIKTSGHLIGPFEVESVLNEHPAVSGSGVFGKPDPVAGAIVKAVVVLNDGYEADEGMRRELTAHARRRLGSAVAPREMSFVDALPQTRSGKIMRRLLRARELGLPEGDLSTLETGA